MKKLVVVLAILAIAVPSMAATTVSCAQVGTTKAFTVSYAYDAVGSFPRAFALDITTSAGTISGVTATKVGESIVGATGFGIFPGTIAIDSTGSVTSNGVPVAPQADLPTGTLAGIGTAGATIELGSLYASTAAKPANSGVIVTVALTTTANSAMITIVPNVARGGVVLEDATSVATFSSTCPLTFATPPCKGDVNASGQVTTADLTSLATLLTTYGGKTKVIASSSTNFNLAADANVDGSNTTGDLTKIATWLTTYGGKTKVIACPHTYN